MSFEGKWLIAQYFPLMPAPELFVPGETTLQVVVDQSGSYTVFITGLNPELVCQDVEVPAQVENNVLVSDDFEFSCQWLKDVMANVRMSQPQGTHTGGTLNAWIAAPADPVSGFGPEEEPVATWTAEEEGGMV